MLKKKADITAEAMLWIFKILFLILVIGSVQFIASGFISREINTNEASALSILNRITYGEKCLLYNDGVKDLIGVIDLSLLTEERLEKCLGISGSEKGAIVSLFDSEKNLVKKIEANKARSGFIAACDVKKKDFQCLQKEVYIAYKDGSIKSGTLRLDVVVFDA